MGESVKFLSPLETRERNFDLDTYESEALHSFGSVDLLETITDTGVHSWVCLNKKDTA